MGSPFHERTMLNDIRKAVEELRRAADGDMIEAANRLELHDRILRNIEFGHLREEMARYAEKVAAADARRLKRKGRVRRG
jgi:hypothetical protein